MRRLKFATELRGKTVLTEGGELLGLIDNFLMDMSTGSIVSMLVIPRNDLEARLFKIDHRGRIVLPFKNVKSARDVIVVAME